METVVSTAVNPAAEEQKRAELPHSRPHVEVTSNGAGSEAFNKNPTSPSQ